MTYFHCVLPRFITCAPATANIGSGLEVEALFTLDVRGADISEDGKCVEINSQFFRHACVPDGHRRGSFGGSGEILGF